MYTPTAGYRTTQITSSGPAGQIILLYQGAIRFGAQHLAALQRMDPEAAHHASIRAQAIVAELHQTLDLSAGPIAVQLGQLYGFVLDRLVEGNLSKTPKPTEDALFILRGLLEAWQAIATPVSSQPRPRATGGLTLVGAARK
jgi:flagellar protein FliS